MNPTGSQRPGVERRPGIEVGHRATTRSIRSRCARFAGSSRNEPSMEFRTRVTRSRRSSASAPAVATKLSSR